MTGMRWTFERLQQETMKISECKLLSKEDGIFNVQKTKLTFLCSCCKKNTFISTWSNFKNNKLSLCDECNPLKLTENKIRKYTEENSKCKFIKAIDGYKNYHTTNLVFSCEECGEEFITSFTMFARNKNPRRKCHLCSQRSNWNTETLSSYIDKISNGEYKLLSEFKNAQEKLTMKHLKCGNEYKVNANNFINGKRCPICSIEKRTDKLRSDSNELQKKLNDLSPNGYLILGEYVNNHSEIKMKKIKCGHEFKTTPANILDSLQNGYDYCPKCNKRELKTHEEFVNEIEKYAKGEYKFHSEYKGNKKHIIVEHIACGYIWRALPGTLLKIKSKNKGHICCANCNKSEGEREVTLILNEQNIKYEIQKQFDNLLGLGGGNLSYDFYLSEYNLLIEYQGEQHYSHREGWVTKEDFEKQQIHDNLKRQFAKDNGYELLEIPYTDFQNIETILTNKLQQLNNENIKTTA